jgi:hypothetical protein
VPLIVTVLVKLTPYIIRIMAKKSIGLGSTYEYLPHQVLEAHLTFLTDV